MFLKLRIIFTILSAICAAAVLPVGTFLGLAWAITAALAAVAFFLIMLIFKQEQEKREPQPLEEPSNEEEEEKTGEEK